MQHSELVEGLLKDLFRWKLKVKLKRPTKRRELGGWSLLDGTRMPEHWGFDELWRDVSIIVWRQFNAQSTHHFGYDDPKFMATVWKLMGQAHVPDTLARKIWIRLKSAEDRIRAPKEHAMTRTWM